MELGFCNCPSILQGPFRMKSKKTFVASAVFGRSSQNCPEDQKTISRNKMPFSSGP
jgi:hypothetical protein